MILVFPQFTELWMTFRLDLDFLCTFVLNYILHFRSHGYEHPCNGYYSIYIREHLSIIQ